MNQFETRPIKDKVDYLYERCGDYELKMLLRRFKVTYSSPNTEKNNYAFFYMRAIVKYMSRLVFAIGWSKIRSYANQDVEREFYKRLFREPSEKSGKESIEPGKLADVLRKCAETITHSNDVSGEVNLLKALGDVRNKESHDIYSSHEKYYSSALNVFKTFVEMFDGKDCSYIIPVSKTESRIICHEFRCDRESFSEIRLPDLCFSWSSESTHLFYYRVLNKSTAEERFFYLSPFIAYSNDYIGEDIGEERTHFYVYEYFNNSGYGDGFDHFTCYKIVPKRLIKSEEDKFEAIFDECEFKYRYSDMFVFSGKAGDNTLWISSPRNDVYINISSYPGYGDVMTGSYSYCMEICPIRKKILDFCKNNRRQLAFVTGHGGVGKTALVLSIIKELYFGRQLNDYTNLIFLSAKKSFLGMDRKSSLCQQSNNDPDFGSYDDFIGKLSPLFEIAFEESIPSDKKAKLIIEKINTEAHNTSSKKRFLIIIDDLDSLARADQEKIIDFLNELSPLTAKSIITTRNIAESNMPGFFVLDELSVEDRVKFADWYIENKMGIRPLSWSRRDTALRWIKNSDEMTPLTIQMLLCLAEQGLEDMINAPMTKNEQAKYFNCSVMNMLSDKEKIIFEICRKIFNALPENDRDQMRVSIPAYLAAGCDLSQADCESALIRLQNLRLFVKEKNDQLFRPYSEFILKNDIFSADGDTIPRMYELFWRDIKEKPAEWHNYSYIERVIFDAIRSAEGDNLFNFIIAEKIADQLMRCEYLYPELKKELQNWLNERSVISGSESQNIFNARARVLEDINKNWLYLKQLLEHNGNREQIEELEGELHSSISDFRENLDKNPDQELKERFKRLMEDIEYTM